MHRVLNVLLPIFLSAVTPSIAAVSDAPQRVVSLGGSVTEIVYDLDMGHVLVGDDLSSVYPPQATQLPRVGYYRSLPLEGLISLQPDLILASEQAGPPGVLDRVRGLGVPVEIISDTPSLDSLYKRILQIATELRVPRQGQELERRVRAKIDTAIDNGKNQTRNTKPVNAIVLMKRTSQIQAAGGDTTAGTLVRLAGLNNVLEQQQGYKPLSVEGLAVLQPELIITTTGSIEALGGQQAFEQSAGINLTPAAQRGHVLIVDDLLILGLGPRTAQTIQNLVEAGSDVRAGR